MKHTTKVLKLAVSVLLLIGCSKQLTPPTTSTLVPSQQLNKNMSYAWSFHSFSINKFKHYFGHATPEEVEAMVEAAIWQEKAEGSTVDLAPIKAVVRHVATNGLSYAGLTPEQAKILDHRLGVLFSPEGIEDLEIEPESPDFVHPSIIAELIQRAQGRVELKILPVLAHGWRHGEDNLAANCEYVILFPELLPQLAAEIETVVKLPLPWSEDYVPEVVDECLLKVIRNVISKKKGLAGFLG